MKWSSTEIAGLQIEDVVVAEAIGITLCNLRQLGCNLANLRAGEPRGKIKDASVGRLPLNCVPGKHKKMAGVTSNKTATLSTCVGKLL